MAVFWVMFMFTKGNICVCRIQNYSHSTNDYSLIILKDLMCHSFFHLAHYVTVAVAILFTLRNLTEVVVPILLFSFISDCPSCQHLLWSTLKWHLLLYSSSVDVLVCTLNTWHIFIWKWGLLVSSIFMAHSAFRNWLSYSSFQYKCTKIFIFMAFMCKSNISTG